MYAQAVSELIKPTSGNCNLRCGFHVPDQNRPGNLNTGPIE